MQEEPMPYHRYRDGLYLARQHSGSRKIDHYGIIDAGNRLGLRRDPYLRETLVHQTPPSLRIEPLLDPKGWVVLGRIENEAAARWRIDQARQNPKYDLF